MELLWPDGAEEHPRLLRASAQQAIEPQALVGETVAASVDRVARQRYWYR
ncbi:MAG: hypothetical protein KME32_31935 [Mojavia pulchra JT2-VF2]|jgi:hypothetical protein|uniref:Uncharacterized protein n=1 Tax=Mojavia pulchra JT2-VF2 TaxID=287848 RepID=A0A951Q415_9NOST|nr:hypothetical protein [Mojavia pulchra JT2-VF2]